MSLPQTRTDMLHARYRLLNPAAHCGKCRATVELWETTHAKKVYFNPPSKPGANYEEAILHRITCTAANKQPEQQSLFKGTFPQRQKALGQLAAACNARVALLLQDDGYVCSVRPGITGDEAAHELITAANKVRRDLGGFTQ